MKKFNITISGYGAEVAIGKLNPEQIEIVKREVELGTSLTTIVWDEMLGQSFYEMDDVYHNWGVGDVFSIHITDESGQTLYEFTDNSLPGDVELFEYIDRFQDSDVEMIMSVSGEKGVFFESEIVCEEFDLSKLKIIVDSEVGIPDYYYGDMFSKVLYDGEELDNIGGSTDGKYFEVGTNIQFDKTPEKTQVMKSESYLLYLSQTLERISKFCEENKVMSEEVNQSCEVVAKSIDDLINTIEESGFDVSHIHK